MRLLLIGATLAKDDEAESVACDDRQDDVSVHGHHNQHYDDMEEGVEQ